MSAGQAFLPVAASNKAEAKFSCSWLTDFQAYSKKEEHASPGGDQAHSDGPGVLWVKIRSCSGSRKAAKPVCFSFRLQPSLVGLLTMRGGRESWSWASQAWVLARSLNSETSDHSWPTHSIRSRANNSPQAAPWHLLLYHFKVPNQLRRIMIPLCTVHLALQAVII